MTATCPYCTEPLQPCPATPTCPGSHPGHPSPCTHCHHGYICPTHGHHWPGGHRPPTGQTHTTTIGIDLT